MKPEQLYSILNIPSPKPKPVYHHDLIISSRYRELFKLACETIINNPKNHSAAISDLAIFDYTNSEKETVITRFRGIDNPEEFRGMTFRNIYIEESANNTDIKNLFGHLSKNIVIIGDKE